MADVNIGTLRGYIELEDRLTPKLQIAGQGIAKLGKDLDQLGSRMQTAGLAMTPLSAAITGLGAVSATTFAVFEREMNRVAAISGATEEQFAALEHQAKELGRTTQFTTRQAADAMGFLAMAGLRANDILGAMPSVLQLAASAQMDMGRAADITTNILTGYNMRVEELGRVNDVLVKAFTSANTNLEQLGEAFKYAGPVAKAAGIEFEQAAAALALMGNAGLQSSMAGTSLRGAITRLLNPTNEAAELMQALGVTATDAHGRLLPLDQILEQLAPHAENAGAFMEIFGQRAGPGMMALVGQGVEKLRELTRELENSAGIAQKVADVQMQGLMGSWLELESAAEGLAIAVGDALSPALSGVLDIGTVLFTFATERLLPTFLALPQPIQLATTSIILLGAAIGPLLIVLGTLVRMSGVFMQGYVALNSVLFTLGNTVPILTARLALLEMTERGNAIATGINSAAKTHFAGVLTAVNLNLNVLSARLGLNTVATYASAAADKIAAAAKAAHATATNLLAGSQLVLGARMAATTAATTLQSAAIGVGSLAMKGLSLAVAAVQKAFLPFLAAWAGWEIGKKVREIELFGLELQDWVPVLYNWRFGLGELTLEELKLSEASRRRMLRMKESNAALADATVEAQLAAEAYKNLKDRLSGAKLAKDMEDLTRALEEFKTAGQLTPDILKRIATEAKLLADQGQRLTPQLQALVETFSTVPGTGGKTITEELAATKNALAALTAEQRTQIKAAFELGMENEAIVASLKRMGLGANVTAKVIEFYKRQLEGAGSATNEFGRQVQELTSKLESAFRLNIATDSIIEMYGSEVERIIKQAPFFQHALTKPIIELDMELGRRDVRKQLDELAERFEKIAQEAREADFKKLVEEANDFIKAMDEFTGAAAVQKATKQVELFKTALRTGFTLSTLPISTLKSLFADLEAGILAMRLAGAPIPDEWREISAEVGGYLSRISGALENTTSRTRMLALMNPFGKALQDAKEVPSTLERISGRLSNLSAQFANMAQISDGTFGKVSRGIGTLIAGLDTALSSTLDFVKVFKENGSKLKGVGLELASSLMSGILGGISMMGQMTQFDTTLGNALGGAASGAITGAGIGMTIGAAVASSAASGMAIGGIWGAVAGAIVGTFIGVFRGRATRQYMQDVGREWGVDISKGLAEQLREEAKQVFGGNRQATEIYNLDEILGEAGGLTADNFNKFMGKLRDIFVMVETNAFTAAQGVEALDKNFRTFADYITKNGSNANRQLLEIIQLSRRMGLESQAIHDFVNEQSARAVGGFRQFFDARAEALSSLGDAQKKLNDLIKEKAPKEKIAEARSAVEKLTNTLAAMPLTAEGALGFGAGLAAIFGEAMRQGQNIITVLRDIGPLALTMADQFKEAGVDGGPAFAELLELAKLAGDEIAGPALGAVSGLNDALSGLHNSALMTDEIFMGLTGTISQTHAALVKQGVDGDLALRLLQPSLQTAWELMTDFGYAVNDATRELINQGLEMGIVGEEHRSVQEQMLRLTERMTLALEGLATHFGVNLVNAVDDFGTALDNLPDRINIDVDANFPEIPSWAADGNYTRHGPGSTGPGMTQIPGAASGIFATGRGNGAVTWFGEGGEPELGGPVDFMSAVLASAMQRRQFEEEPSEPSTHVTVVFEDGAFRAIDTNGLRELVERDLVPIMTDIYRRDTRKARTEHRAALRIKD